jgi:undecaprenyl-diphosphatase
LVPELSRICLGLHYPTDIVGSVALAAAVVWPAQTRWPSAFGTWLVRWEKRSAPTFYMCAFILSYELTTTFSSLRAVGASLLG